MGWFSDNDATKAKDYIETFEGRRQLAKALFTSDEAVVTLLGAKEMRTKEPKCPTCQQHWDKGNVDYEVVFADGSILTGFGIPR